MEREDLKAQLPRPSRLRLFQQGLGLSSSSSRPVQTGFSGTLSEDDWEIDAREEVVVAFTSEPTAAMVVVDGDVLCTTPCSRPIPSGVREVVVQKERYKSWRRSLSVSNGDTVLAVLDPTFGFLSVSSDVRGVEIHLDGEKLGTTPIQDVEVDLGVHTLSVVDSCYTGQDYTFQMTSNQREEVSKYPVQPRLSAVKVSVVDGKDGKTTKL